MWLEILSKEQKQKQTKKPNYQQNTALSSMMDQEKSKYSRQKTFRQWLLYSIQKLQKKMYAPPLFPTSDKKYLQRPSGEPRFLTLTKL